MIIGSQVVGLARPVFFQTYPAYYDASRDNTWSARDGTDIVHHCQSPIRLIKNELGAGGPALIHTAAYFPILSIVIDDDCFVDDSFVHLYGIVNGPTNAWYIQAMHAHMEIHNICNVIYYCCRTSFLPTVGQFKGSDGNILANIYSKATVVES